MVGHGIADEDAIAALAARSATSPIRSSSSDAERTRGHLGPEELPKPADRADAAAWARWTWHEVWNRRRIDRLAEAYANNYHFHGPSGRRSSTREEIQRFVLTMLAAFPDATLHLEHVASSKTKGTTLVSVRWRLQGTYEGSGPYGAASGTPVEILGITHQHFDGERFTAEWTVFDELALLALVAPPQPESYAPPSESHKSE